MIATWPAIAPTGRKLEYEHERGTFIERTTSHSSFANKTNLASSLRATVATERWMRQFGQPSLQLAGNEGIKANASQRAEQAIIVIETLIKGTPLFDAPLRWLCTAKLGGARANLGFASNGCNRDCNAGNLNGHRSNGPDEGDTIERFRKASAWAAFIGLWRLDLKDRRGMREKGTKEPV